MAPWSRQRWVKIRERQTVGEVRKTKKYIKG
jgi:hypothetical protein